MREPSDRPGEPRSAAAWRVETCAIYDINTYNYDIYDTSKRKSGGADKREPNDRLIVPKRRASAT